MDPASNPASNPASSRLDRTSDSDTTMPVDATALAPALRTQTNRSRHSVHAGGNDGNDGLAPVISSDAKVEIVNNKPAFKPGRNFFLAFSALMLLALAIAIDATSLSVALPVVSKALGGSALEAFWSGTSFLLASTIVMPSVAALSNIFGRKNMVYAMVFFFGGGSLLGALAGNFTVLIAGRTVQGIGGGGIMALIEVITCDMVPLAFRPMYMSIISIMWSVGTVTGPLIGAGFAQNVSWRWILYINLPLIAVGFAAIIAFLHQTAISGGIVQKLRRFDWIGSLLFTASTTSFLFGVTTGGTMHPWDSVNVLLPLIIGPFGLLLFGVYEFKVATEPIISRGIFNNYTLIISYFLTMMHGLILWSCLYFLPLYFEGVLGYKPVIAAVAILPMTLTVAPAAAVVGVVAGITARYRWSLWVGWALTTLGSGLLLLLKPDTSIPAWIFLTVPFGLGTGMLFPAMTLSIQAACEPVLNGQASAFFAFMRTFGEAVGVAITGVIFQNGLQKKLLALPGLSRDLALAYSHDATSLVGVLNAMPAGTEKTVLTKAYNDSMYDVFYAQLAFSALGLLLSFLIRGYSLNQELVTEQGLVDKKKENMDAAAAAAEKLQSEP